MTNTATAPRTAELWTLVAAILASSMAFIDGSAIAIVQAILQREFNADYTLVAWVINGYNLMLAALILVGGAMGDRFGRKRVFTLGIIVFTLSSLACALAPSVGFLIAARIAQGIGGALMIPGSLALISAVFPSERRGTAIGIWSAAGAVMVIAGPILAGFFAAAENWRGVFFINLPIALVALFALTRVPESRSDEVHGPLDLAGALLVTLGLGGLTYAFTEAPVQGWSQPLIVASLVVGIVGLIGFVLVEARAQAPMMPLRLFRVPAFAGTNLLTLFLYGGLALISTFLPLNLIEVQGYPAQIASLTLLPLALSLIFISSFSGGLVKRFGARALLTVGPAAAGVGMFLLGLPGLTSGAGDYWATFFPGALLLGVGMGITVAPLTTTVMNSAPTDMSGTASGINNAVSRAAGVLAIAIFTALALTSFASAVSARTEPLPLNDDVRSALSAEAAKLANARTPEGVPVDVQPQVAEALQLSFVDTFRIVAWGAAALALLGAVMGFVFVRRGADADRPAEAVLQAG